MLFFLTNRVADCGGGHTVAKYAYVVNNKILAKTRGWSCRRIYVFPTDVVNPFC